MTTPDPEIAYLAEGKLYHKPSGQDVKNIDSHFLQELIDRRNRDSQRSSWKQSGSAWNVTAQQDWQAIAQVQGAALAGATRMENITSVCIGQQVPTALPLTSRLDKKLGSANAERQPNCSDRRHGQHAQLRQRPIGRNAPLLLQVLEPDAVPVPGLPQVVPAHRRHVAHERKVEVLGKGGLVNLARLCCACPQGRGQALQEALLLGA